MGNVTPDQITAFVVALTALIAAIGSVVSVIYGKQIKLLATDASHDATHARNAAEFTVSQTAAIQQTLVEHCGAICPSIVCPLRRPEEAKA